MKTRLPLLLALTLFSASCLMVVSDGPLPSRSFERSSPLEPGSEVRVDLPEALVAIEGWNRKELLVKGSLSSTTNEFLQDADLSLQRRGTALELTSSIYKPVREDIEIKATLRTPFETDLSCTIPSGDLSLRSLRGKIGIQGEDLSIDARDVGGKLTLSTGKGPIILVLLESEPEDSFDITTLSGTVILEVPDRTPLTLDLKSEEGTVEVKGDFPEGGAHVRIRSRSGAIKVLARGR